MKKPRNESFAAFFITGLEHVGKGQGKREFSLWFNGVYRGLFPCKRVSAVRCPASGTIFNISNFEAEGFKEWKTWSYLAQGQRTPLNEKAAKHSFRGFFYSSFGGRDYFIFSFNANASGLSDWKDSAVFR